MCFRSEYTPRFNFIFVFFYAQKINTQITEQLESAYKVNNEIAHSMSKLGISLRPTVSEWLRKKDEEKRAQIKSTLHSWRR